MKRSRNKSQNIIQLIIVVGIVILVNVVAAFLFTRIDLTGDKRFTISETSKKTLAALPDVVYVKVYLEGDFPAGFQKLRNATQEMLDELRTYSNGNLEYEFIDPSSSDDEKERNKVYHQLAEKGLQPTNLETKSNEGTTTQKVIFPGAIVSYSRQEVPVQLLKDQIGVSSVQMLNNSIQNLEYEIVSAIKKATDPLKPTIAFLTGQGELDEKRVEDITNVLSSVYKVERISIDQKLGSLDEYRAVIIAKPDSAFVEKDKFIIDQYIMKGGHILWAIDPMEVSMDSLGSRGETMALGRPLNIDDMLFRYGIRINYDLILDLQAAPIPIVTGFIGNQPKTELRPWYYFPVMTPMEKHPIVNNLNAIRGQFVSSMDTVGAPTIDKTVLLTGSRYSKIAPAPVRVNLGIMQMKAQPAQYNRSYLTTAVLLEGKFVSLYKNTILADTMRKLPEIGFTEENDSANRMIVISDGDILSNDFQKGRALACGYDKYSGTYFGNRSFIQNCIDYLVDESGLMSVRSKEFKIRMLDPKMVEENEHTIKILNCILPVLIVIVFGLIKFFRRKRKYAI